MKREMKYTWLSKEDFTTKNPRQFSIVGFAKNPDDETDLVLIDGGDGIRKWSLSSKLNNLLLEKYGEDDAAWIGKVVFVEQTSQNGTYRRSVVKV